MKTDQCHICVIFTHFYPHGRPWWQTLKQKLRMCFVARKFFMSDHISKLENIFSSSPHEYIEYLVILLLWRAGILNFLDLENKSNPCMWWINPLPPKVILLKRIFFQKGWLSFEPCHIGIHLKVLNESFKMNTNVTGFQLLSSFFY